MPEKHTTNNKEGNLSSVTFHKAGRSVRIKPNDIIAVEALQEIMSRQFVPCMRSNKFYEVAGKEVELKYDNSKILIFRWLMEGIENHPLIGILSAYGVDVTISPCLQNYMAKEKKRQVRESAPYPTLPIDTDVSLFDRCCEGLVLKCTKELKAVSGVKLFEVGKRYMVLATGGEGKDIVTISTLPVVANAKMDLIGAGHKHKWTTFDTPMEEYFDDTESVQLGKDITKLYPEQLKEVKAELKDMNLPLYEHVEVDSVMMSMKRGVLNGYLMRMGKTSAAIATAELSKSKKIAAVSPGNARLFWTKEFKRLGFKEEEDFLEVRSLADLDKDVKYHLMTYTWLALGKDKQAKARGKMENLLKPSSKWTKQKAGVSWPEKEEVETRLFNLCPHCDTKMQRATINPITKKAVWTDRKGYICRNDKCSWITKLGELDSKKKITKSKTLPWPVPWASTKPITHKGGYVDYELARHANCEDVKVKGRMCLECHTADSSWVPPRYKRIMKKYTHVILDEAHGAKDDSTATAQAAFNFKARRRQCLTGTPMANSALDMYWLLHWSQNAPSIGFPYFREKGEKEFKDGFCDKISIDKPAGTELSATGQVTQLTKVVSKTIPFLKNPPEFWKFIAPKMRRRTYGDPLFKKTLTANGRFMPTPEVNKVVCPMDPVQAALMLASIKDFRGMYEKLQKEADKKGQMVNPTLVISQMATMKTVATCPEYLNDKFGSKVYVGAPGGGKIPYMRQIIEDKLKHGGKVLILSDFKKMQETCNEAFKKHGTIKFLTSWDDEERLEAFDSFQNDPEKKIFIAGTRAIREGVDLSAADSVICTDLLWSPSFQMQAWSRIMAPTTKERICDVYLMLSGNSLDEHIFNVFYSKMVAAEQALDRKVLNRRAQEIDIKWFVDRVLEEEVSLARFIRDADAATLRVANIDLSKFVERED